MPYTRIDGTTSVVGAAPDGDSVHFTPLRPDAWLAAGLRVRANAHGGVQLRLDAVDSLETHYAPPGGGAQVHQPLPLAHAAAERLLALLGFADVTRDPGERVLTASPAQVPVTVLTDGTDANGRCLALVYAQGTPAPGADGGRVRLSADDLALSANAVLLDEGLAYPTFYAGLPAELREPLAQASTRARAEGRGVWAEDLTTAGVAVEGLATLTEQAVVLPKLFRRLVEYLALGGEPSAAAAGMEGFRGFLDARGDRLVVLPTGEVTGFSTVVDVTGDTVRLTLQPEQLVFLEG